MLTPTRIAILIAIGVAHTNTEALLLIAEAIQSSDYAPSTSMDAALLRAAHQKSNKPSTGTQLIAQQKSIVEPKHTLSAGVKTTHSFPFTDGSAVPAKSLDNHHSSLREVDFAAFRYKLNTYRIKRHARHGTATAAGSAKIGDRVLHLVIGTFFTIRRNKTDGSIDETNQFRGTSRSTCE